MRPKQSRRTEANELGSRSARPRPTFAHRTRSLATLASFQIVRGVAGELREVDAQTPAHSELGEVEDTRDPDLERHEVPPLIHRRVDARPDELLVVLGAHAFAR